MRSFSFPRSLAAFLGGTLLGVLSACPVQGQDTLTWQPAGAGGSGTWDTSTPDWSNGTGSVPWTNGDNARFNGPAGTVSISGTVTAGQVTFGTPGYTVQNFFLLGMGNGLTVQTDADATISSSIFGAAPYNTPFTKTGGGVLSLPGQGPIFFGSVTVAAGEMRFTGTGSPDFSTPFVLANAPGVALTLGAGYNTVASLGGGGTNGGVVRPNAASGTVTLNIGGSGNASFGGLLQDGSNATLALQKSGTGTQTLTGANTYTGATTVNGGRLVFSGTAGSALASTSVTVNAGSTLLLDNSSGSVSNPNHERLPGNLPVTLAGGTLAMTGSPTDSTKQGFASLNFSRASAVSVTPAGTTDTKLVVLGALTRQDRGTISFSNGGVYLYNQTNLNGIVGAYATVGSDWASVGTGGAVVAYTGYTGLASASGQDNVRITTAGGNTTSLAATPALNTLNLVNTGSAPAVLDLGAGHTLDLTAGGVLTSGAAGHVIQNGSLGSSGGELLITNQSALTVYSTITNFASPNGNVAVGLTKSGAGTLVLAGTNTYTGATTIDQGTVQAAAASNLGGSKTVALNGGTLQATGNLSLPGTSLQGSGGTLNTNGHDVAFYGGNNTGSVTKVGAGMLTLTGTVGSMAVNAGTLSLQKLVANNATSITLNGGRLEAAGTVQTVSSLGGTGSEISPGGLGQAASLTLGSLTVFTPTVVDFDLGGGTGDRLAVSSNLFLGGGSGPQLLFRFGDLGGTRTGTPYALLQLPSFQAFQFQSMLGEFGIDPASTAAGYRGTFSIVNGTLDVTFSAVPEPGAAATVLLGAFAAGLIRARRGGKRGA